MKKCHKCDFEMDDGIRFCPKCATNVSESIFNKPDNFINDSEINLNQEISVNKIEDTKHEPNFEIKNKNNDDINKMNKSQANANKKNTEDKTFNHKKEPRFHTYYQEKDKGNTTNTNNISSSKMIYFIMGLFFPIGFIMYALLKQEDPKSANASLAGGIAGFIFFFFFFIVAGICRVFATLFI